MQYCPTEQMLADFFTKPLQGSLFRKFWDVIMGHKHIDSLKETPPTPSQERVGKGNLVRKGGYEANGQKTDGKAQEPTDVTYANIVRRKRSMSLLVSERKKKRSSHSQEIIPS